MGQHPLLFPLIVLFIASMVRAEDLPVVHIYGFGEFPGAPFYNASGDIVSRHLPEALRTNCRERVRFTFEAPVTPDRANADRIVERSNTRRITIGLGITQNVPARGIRIETEAANCFQPMSRELEPPPATCVIREGATSRKICPLPESVVDPVQVDGNDYPVGFGNGVSCGSYVCNSSFYQGLQRGHDQLFFHISNLPPPQQPAFAKAIAQVICRSVAARLRPWAFRAPGERPHAAGAQVIVDPSSGGGKRHESP